VWYRWTPSNSGSVTFNTDGSDFDTRLAVYTGSAIAALREVASNNDENAGLFNFRTSRVAFNALAGTTYYIAVDDGGGFQLTGRIQLNWGTPASINGRIVDIRGVGVPDVQVTLSGDGSRFRRTDAQGNYSFSNLILGGSYTVTPDTSRFTYDLTSRTYDPFIGDVTDANFTALTPVYSITGTVRTLSGVAVPNVAVRLSGSSTEIAMTTPEGVYTFSPLATNGIHTVTPASSAYSFHVTGDPGSIAYSFPVLNGNIIGADFTAEPTPTRALTVASSNPNSGVNITVSPDDNGAQGNGTTQFTRTYNLNANVNLSAPATAGGNNFQKWLKDGVDFANNQLTNVSVTMDANHTMTAVYVTPTRTLTVASNPSSGVSITVSPNDNNSAGNGSTQFTRIYNNNTVVSLTAPATVGGNNFQKWLKDGADFANNQLVNVSVTMDANHTMTAVYLTATRTLTVASSNPSSGVSITVSPNDNGAQGNGTTQFTRNYNNSTVVTLTAPATASGNNFQKWQRDGVDFATTLATTVTMDANHTMAAIYATPEITQHFLTMSAGTDTRGGTVSPASGLFNAGTSVSILATANTGYRFSGWTGSGAGSFTGATSEASVTMNGPITQIADFTPVSNPLEDRDFFVRQQYRDFLDREADPAGLIYWRDKELGACPDATCIRKRRIGVSAAFFVELEFQRTGSVVYRMHRAAFGTLPNTTTRANITFLQFIADRALLPENSDIAQITISFANTFVQRSGFLIAYPASLTNAQFVNKLFDTAGLTPYTTERLQQINAMTNNGRTRAQVLLDVIEIAEFKTREYNRSFVLMQYFGYLRRDPDQGGYDFWLGILNNPSVSNIRSMVCAFLTSTEYQERFSSLVPRDDKDCADIN
jgi:hypothetical protein